MPEEQFEEHKKALATIRLEKPKMLSARCTLYWNEITSQQYNFDRVNIEVAYLKTITRQQLLNFCKVITLLLNIEYIYFKLKRKDFIVKKINTKLMKYRI